MDILLDLLILGNLVLWVFLVVVMILKRHEKFDSKWWFVLPMLGTFVIFAAASDDYLGDEAIEGTVYAVSRAGSDTKTKVEFSGTIKAEVESSTDILKAYEVAIIPRYSNRVRILENNNSLLRLKFNKREIQLQLQPDKRYRFHLHRLFLRKKNILDIEPL